MFLRPTNNQKKKKTPSCPPECFPSTSDPLPPANAPRSKNKSKSKHYPFLSHLSKKTPWYPQPTFPPFAPTRNPAKHIKVLVVTRRSRKVSEDPKENKKQMEHHTVLVLPSGRSNRPKRESVSPNPPNEQNNKRRCDALATNFFLVPLIGIDNCCFSQRHQSQKAVQTSKCKHTGMPTPSVHPYARARSFLLCASETHPQKQVTSR